MIDRQSSGLFRPPSGSRGRRGGFKPGISGNPGGRPAGIRAHVHARVGANGEKLFDFWMLIAFGQEADIRRRFGARTVVRLQERMQAVEELANRGFGKPTLPIDAELSGAIEIRWSTDGSDVDDE